MLVDPFKDLPGMLDRRRFLQCIAAAATTPSALTGCDSAMARRPQDTLLKPDPHRKLELHEGLDYRIVSRMGRRMSDGLVMPGNHDGMAAFAGPDGRIILICNHELDYNSRFAGALADLYPQASPSLRSRFYDAGSGVSPGLGGTTTTIYDPVQGRIERQFLSLAGTEFNCAGGPTPWGSWLSCEECFENPGKSWNTGFGTTRDQRHGYVFEVPAAATALIDPLPIKAMGRFEHEACAVHEHTGIVYMTEDRHHGLFYRYIPDVPGRLHEGGRLQALAVVGASGLPTHNWTGDHEVPLRKPLSTYWVDLDDVDPVENDLRLRGAVDGAAMFARGEGLCVAGDRFAFTCTIGGPARLGQVFTYKPSPHEGTAEEQDAPGELELIAESSRDSLLRNADNLTMAPWGDLIVCEDTAKNCGLVGVRPDGSQYLIANNPYSNSELAGVCFSPDRQTMFVNIQYPGMTFAISGDWGQFA
jgi:secreted PhoX family phosphatase